MGAQDWASKSEEYIAKGYIPVSMRSDFAQIYADGITKAPQQFREQAWAAGSQDVQAEEAPDLVQTDYSAAENWAYFAEGEEDLAAAA